MAVRPIPRNDITLPNILQPSPRPAISNEYDPVQEPEPEPFFEQRPAAESRQANKPSLKVAIALTGIGILSFGVGVMYAITSKEAGNFEAFYWNIIYSNTFSAIGIVFLYHSIPMMLVSIVDSINGLLRERKLNNI